MSLPAPVALSDKFELTTGKIFVTGTQALARLPVVQRRRDKRDGIRSAAYISGYRGSPLGTLDQALQKAGGVLKSLDIVFRPGLNEDLAATAIWGTQQANAMEGALYDGVLSMWYGKGPGVDRSGDVFKHGNAAGSSRFGGVLLVAGDDHAAKSSTLPHQSDYAFVDAGIPVIAPAGAQEFAPFAVLGWAMSRYSGCWVAFKALTSAIESSVVIDADDGMDIAIKDPVFDLPEGGVHIRMTDDWWEPEARLYNYKLPAAQAFARANGLDRIALGKDKPARLGIITAGKGYLDVQDALRHLELDSPGAEALGIRVLKYGLVWPIDPVVLQEFAQGLDEILVVEEKRPLIEDQVKAELFNSGTRTRVIGKKDEAGRVLLPLLGELDPLRVAVAIASRLQKLEMSPPEIGPLVSAMERQLELAKHVGREDFARPPHYCSGCPHNSSTVVPEGSRAAAGIGCHVMARIMERNTYGFTQMGGEGAQWVGMAPFTQTPHLFQNLGDGTYFHSGILGIRQSVAANVNITYKILFNDAVAMTGGQSVDGVLTVPDVVRQMLAENVKKVVVVSDDAEKYPAGFIPVGVDVHDRSSLDFVQRQLREIPGVTVLVYDQTCAAEKRRRRKRGKMSEPTRSVVINDRVCEGCGDCSVKSNCLSVIPKSTDFGVKRTIDQSSCNKDFSCLNGFCPSFVTVDDAKPKKPKLNQTALTADGLPDPVFMRSQANIVITGVGGTGVVTIGALLGTAAHIEGRGVTVLDMTGAAQKGGAVFTHVRLSQGEEGYHTARIPDGEADLILGCDLVVTATADVLGRAHLSRTRAIVNNFETITASFTRQSQVYQFPQTRLAERISAAVGRNDAEFLNATEIATRLLGDSIAVNVFMMGYAWQKGLIPVGAAAIDQAIELNGVAIEFNRKAFLYGRIAAYAPEKVVQVDTPSKAHTPLSYSEAKHLRCAELVNYQNEAYSRKYSLLVQAIEDAEAKLGSRRELSDTVMRNLYKLMAYKDEYEVARLHANTAFVASVNASFEGKPKLRFHLSPPLFARKDPSTGLPKKYAFGSWVLPLFRALAVLKPLRGTAFDAFSYTHERRAERAWLVQYEQLLSELANSLNSANYDEAVAVASIPDAIRGYGHVKQRNQAEAQEAWDKGLTAYRTARTRRVIKIAA